MCGFIGCISAHLGQVNEEEVTSIKNMNKLIHHRGPDEEGYYFDEYVCFGFKRLSIIDLESGQQPLSYNNDRYWIIFNGEIYNYIELREDLIKQGDVFSTHSDTEVILALYSRYKEKCVEKLRGMFAFAIWDKEEKTLFCARDPFGIKPFFYKMDGEKFYFASEKKSILLAMNEDKLNYDSLQHYLTFQFVPEPYTMSVQIEKLLPGHYMIKKIDEPLKIEKYFSVTFHPVLKTEEEWVKEIRDVLYDSVNVHMRSDVPVGSFLSGGIDSSIIATIAREFHPKIKTFSVGFERKGFSEIDVAKETAEKLGVENYSYVITPEEYMKEFPRIIWHMDDPLADPACVPLYFVSREARKHVTVVLSGEGADELFGGYNIYQEPNSLKIFQRIPSLIKRILLVLSKMMPEGMKGKSFLERGCTPLEERYIGNAKMFTEREKSLLMKHYREDLPYQLITKPLYAKTVGYDDVNRMQYIDIHTWLRGDILLKADKMTMAHSLELRVPFLDKKVFEVASKIPSEMKVNSGTTKYILRKSMEGIVPDHVLLRKKLGFPVPIRHWLKDEMYDWVKQIILESNTDEYIYKQYVLDLLEKHVNGKHDYSRKIWTVITFMIWHAVFIERKYEFEKERLLETVIQ